MKYNTDINILGSIPDYQLIYRLLPLLYAGDDEIIKVLVKNNEFNLRTEKSRRRFLSLLQTAFVHENQSVNDFVGLLFSDKNIDEESKGVVLFWLFSINNNLFRELNENVFFKNYFQGRAELPVDDVEAYLKDLISRTKELQGRWSDSTIRIIASKYLTILKKIQLLEGSRKKTFCYKRISDELLVCLIHIYTLLNQEGKNFLEHEFSGWMFISEEATLERLKKIAKKDWIKMNYTGTSLKIESAFETNNIINGLFRRS